RCTASGTNLRRHHPSDLLQQLFLGPCEPHVLHLHPPDGVESHATPALAAGNVVSTEKSQAGRTNGPLPCVPATSHSLLPLPLQSLNTPLTASACARATS
ncbi:hypothetical protein FN846DRAFT_920324, partial [Sphaerosporella brunnea]